MRDTDAAVAANRFGLGARPGELASIGRDARQWLVEQTRGGPPLIAERLPASHETLARAQALRTGAGTPPAQRQPPAADPGSSPSVQNAARTLREVHAPVHIAEMQARFRQAVVSEHSFLERLTHFWSNHFAVSVDKLAVLGVAGAMEREAIRPHVLGRFEELLLAVEQHPAMLLYLDNAQSIGPHAVAARLAERRGRELGLNENLGREILELHTLGVDGGYTQEDVRSLALMITGWSIGGVQGRLRGGEPGRFHFRDAFHEPDPRRLLGRSYAAGGLEQGVRALRDLAAHPATARHLATKLVRHFVADDPPAAVVEKVAAAYLHGNGDLPTVYRALLDQQECWQPALAKFKSPADYVHSSWRALGLPVMPRDLRVFEQLGQRLLQPGSPAGWPDRSADWDGAAALMKRIEWAQDIGQRLGSRRNARDVAQQSLGAVWSAHSDQAVARAQDAPQALTLLLTAPEFMRR